MAFYRDQVVPRLQDRLMDQGDSRAIRARVCADLSGNVVEVGFGSGLNLPYLPAAVRGVWAVDPSEVGRRLSSSRRQVSGVPVVFAGTDAGSLPFADGRFDAALSTWTLCTLTDPVRALEELARVLRPRGTLHFVEHGLAPDENVARWQRRGDPVQRRMAGGCHLSRDIPALLDAGGFEITSLDTYYERAAPKVLGHMFEGRATASARQPPAVPEAVGPTP